jgi:hypothetical protein
VTDRLAQLGPYSDLVDVAAGMADRPVGDLGTAAVRRLLGFDADRDPLDARVDARWSRDGVDGEEVSWSVGYRAADPGPVPAPVRLACTRAVTGRTWPPAARPHRCSCSTCSTTRSSRSPACVPRTVA